MPDHDVQPGQSRQAAFRDSTLPIPVRARDLLASLSLPEKVALLLTVRV